MMVYDEIERKSICEVMYREGKKKLYRIGDIENGVIERFIPQKDLPPIFDNRLFLFCQDDGPEEEGRIGIWDWTAKYNYNNNEKDYIEAIYSVNEQPIEVFKINLGNSDLITEPMEALIKKLREGIIFAPCCDKFIFCYSINSKAYSGLLCERNMLCYDKNRWLLSDEVISLPICKFSESDVFQFNSKQFIKNLNKRFCSENFFLKSYHEIVKNAISKFAAWPIIKKMGITRKEWQRFKEFIDEVTDDSLLEYVALNCKCSIKKARHYVDDFIKISDEFINGEDIRVLGEIVENHAELKAHCENLVAEKWKEAHRAEIAVKQKELDEIEQELAKHQEEVKRLTEEVEILVVQKNYISDEIKTKEKLADDVEAKVKYKIEAAKNDVAEFISTISLYGLSTGNKFSISDNEYSSTFCAGLNHFEDECNNWKEILQSIEDGLAEAGIAGRYRKSFGAFLYSAYKNHASILLSGPNGESIANAFSIGAFGKTAGILECDGAYRKSVIDEMVMSDDEVVIIKNPFACSWVNHVFELLLPQKRFYILLTPFAEDMMIEPKGIYNYVMPILTEVMIKMAPRNKFIGRKRSADFVDYEKKKVKAIYERVANSLHMGMLIKDRFQRVLTDMHCMMDYKDDRVIEDYIYVFYPYAYLTDKGDAIREKLISEEQLDKETKNYIMNQLGIEE